MSDPGYDLVEIDSAGLGKISGPGVPPTPLTSEEVATLDRLVHAAGFPHLPYVGSDGCLDGATAVFEVATPEAYNAIYSACGFFPDKAGAAIHAIVEMANSRQRSARLENR